MICTNCGFKNSLLYKFNFKYDEKGAQLPCKSCGYNLINEDRVALHFIISTLMVALFGWYDFPVENEWMSLVIKVFIVFCYFIFALPIKKIKQ